MFYFLPLRGFLLIVYRQEIHLVAVPSIDKNFCLSNKIFNIQFPPISKINSSLSWMIKDSDQVPTLSVETIFKTSWIKYRI